MRNRMWFGTKGQETWLPTPAIDPPFTRGAFLSNTPNIYGGTSIQQSKHARRIYALTWNSGKRDDLLPLADFADGVFDTAPGINLIYWVDPMAADRNVLPQHWATPALGSEDAPSLLLSSQPTAAATVANSFRLPARSAVFTQAAGDTPRTQYVPIPPGYQLWAGAIGNAAANNRVLVRDINGTTPGTATPLAILPGTDGVFTNLTLPRTATRTGVQFELATGAATFTLTALTALLLPVGKSPRVGVPWSSGQGNSGCQFAVRPTITAHSAALDSVSAAATLEETGAYL